MRCDCDFVCIAEGELRYCELFPRASRKLEARVASIFSKLYGLRGGGVAEQ